MPNIKFSDGVEIEWNGDVDKPDYTVSADGENIICEPENKPVFKDPSNPGEIVTEFTGLACEDGSHNEHRSWAEARFTPGSASKNHFHSSLEEVYYIMAGTAKVIVDGVESELKTGGSITIEKGQQHQVFNSGKEDMILMVVCKPSWVYTDFNVVNTQSEETLAENAEEVPAALPSV